MHLLFVADGPRDEATIPRLVERILSTSIESSFRPWKGVRLNQGSGYRRKLRFVLAQARDQELDGVVATVDSDRDATKKRLKELCLGRDEDRQNPSVSPMPTAVGEAVPHLEAWLLDDPVSVRNALGLSKDNDIPNVAQGDPKTALNRLIDESESSDRPAQLLSAIACGLDCDRCNHSSDTGFKDFVYDVRAELEPQLSD